MPRNLFSRYIWIIDTLRQYGTISRTALDELWRRSNVSDGDTLPRRTFYNYRNAISDIFKINIDYNPATFEYFINDGGDAHKESVTELMLSSASITNALTDVNDISNRIMVEDVPSARKFLSVIVNSIRESRPLRFNYSAYTHTIPRMGVVVEPYFIKIFRQRWYMTGRNVADNAIKTYALDRMDSVEMTDGSFELPDDFDPEMYFHDSFGIMSSKGKTRNVVLRVEPRQAKYFRALPLHHSQNETIHDNYSIFTYKLKLTYDFVQELLSYGPKVTVVEPAELRAMITENLTASLKNYEQ